MCVRVVVVVVECIPAEAEDETENYSSWMQA